MSNILETSLDRGFTLSTTLSSLYPAKKFIDIDYADDIAVTTDTITNAALLLYYQENAMILDSMLMPLKLNS